MNKEVKDNFLEKDYFEHLKKEVSGCNFPWLYQSNVANYGEAQADHFYFVHRLYEDHVPESSFFEEIKPVLKQLNVAALIRARILLYVNQGTQIIHERHTDYPFPHGAALVYLNTCNGFTEFDDGERVLNKENRLVTFDGSKEHSSSTCTDDKMRLVLAINYF